MDLKKLVDRARRTRKQACRRVDEELARLGKAEQHMREVASAQVVVQNAAQAIQQRAHDQIAAVVSKCLSTVYLDPPEFKIDFEKKRGRTEARLTFVRGGYEEDPVDGSGGGIVDVASFALRLACILLKKPKGRKLIVADEPFKNVNGDGNRERAAELLLTLAKDFDLQIIMTTGYDWLQIGKVVEI